MRSFQLVRCGTVEKLKDGCGIQTASDLLKIKQGGIEIKILKVAGWLDEMNLMTVKIS